MDIYGLKYNIKIISNKTHEIWSIKFDENLNIYKKMYSDTL